MENMSEENSMVGGTPIIKFNEAVEFLEKRAPNNACPVCKYNKWSILVPTEGREGYVSIGLSGVKVSTGDLLTGGMPVITATCKKCAFIRLHSMSDISAWVAKGKPEFLDDEQP